MANYLVNDTQLTSVADAIRAKSGGSSGLTFPEGFVTEIGNIPSGGGGDEAWRGIYNSAVTDPFSITDLSVTNINDYAFRLCKNITAVNFPSCENIGYYAFGSCNLSTANFPSCTYVGNYAFASCSSLTEASFPLCKTIANYAFASCSNLTTANFPSCTIIYGNAFMSCKKLTEANFPLCSYIGSAAFTYCLSLTSTSFPSCSFVGTSAFRRCDSLSIIDLPMCESIGSSVFYECSNLTTVNFTKCSIISGYGAFGYCRTLLSLYLMSNSVCSLQYSNTFTSTPIAGYTDFTSGTYGFIYVPASLLTAYQTTSVWSFFSSRFVGV